VKRLCIGHVLARTQMKTAPDPRFPQVRGRSVWWAILGLNQISGDVWNLGATCDYRLSTCGFVRQ
jgi:hypothetical protein